MAKTIRLNKQSPRIIIRQVGTKGEQGVIGPIGPQGIPGVVQTVEGARNIVVDSTDTAHPIVKTNFNLTISDTPPLNPALNDLWVDTSL